MDFFGYLLLFLFVCVILFLLFREYFCWYFKINERVDLLKQIRDQLVKQNQANPAIENSAVRTETDDA